MSISFAASTVCSLCHIGSYSSAEGDFVLRDSCLSIYFSEFQVIDHCRMNLLLHVFSGLYGPASLLSSIEESSLISYYLFNFTAAVDTISRQEELLFNDSQRFWINSPSSCQWAGAKCIMFEAIQQSENTVPLLQVPISNIVIADGFTVCMWIQFQYSAPITVSLEIGPLSLKISALAMATDSNQTVFFQYHRSQESADSSLVLQYVLIESSWQHICIVKGANELRLYENGTLSSSMNISDPSQLEHASCLNNSCVPATEIKGGFDELRIYKKPLSAGAVESLYNFHGSYARFQIQDIAYFSKQMSCR